MLMKFQINYISEYHKNSPRDSSDKAATRPCNSIFEYQTSCTTKSMRETLHGQIIQAYQYHDQCGIYLLVIYLRCCYYIEMFNLCICASVSREIFLGVAYNFGGWAKPPQSLQTSFVSGWFWQ